MNLKSINKILLFGKSRAFSESEFKKQLQTHQIILVKEYNDNVLVIDGKMMTPYEQIESERLYEEKGVHSINIDILEKELVSQIDENKLLMSLKLSGNRERLKYFLQNSMIKDEFFLKLLKMYRWEGSDFFENDNNRDISAAFISRFYTNIERNHNVAYATTGYIHLIAQCDDSNLLKAIATLEPMQFHLKIECAIAMSSYCDPKLQEYFYKRDEEQLLIALSSNKNLKRPLVTLLLKKSNFGENIARSIELNEELFVVLHQYKDFLAENETLSITMQERLFEEDSLAIFKKLASNRSLNRSLITRLLAINNMDVETLLYENIAMPVSKLKEAYEEKRYSKALAKNENTPVDILYQLQLDSRYERYVKSNAAFGKHIQSENIGWIV